MNHLVKILKSDDGEPRDIDQQYWHLSTTVCGDTATLCHGEFYGVGSSAAEYEVKKVKRGGLTCPECLSMIKEIKAVKL